MWPRGFKICQIFSAVLLMDISTDSIDGSVSSSEKVDRMFTDLNFCRNKQTNSVVLSPQANYTG
jgi:hypothetical protein